MSIVWLYTCIYMETLFDIVCLSLLALSTITSFSTFINSKQHKLNWEHKYHTNWTNKWPEHLTWAHETQYLSAKAALANQKSAASSIFTSKWKGEL